MPLIPLAPSAYATGIDLIEIERVADVLTRHGARFKRRCFTPREIDYCGDRVSEYAVRFAGKEAIMKTLGTGVRGIGWKEIEILANARGKPVVVLHGRALARANRLQLHDIDISLTHSNELAAAVAVGGPGVGGPGNAHGGVGGPRNADAGVGGRA